jgi:hypothetical protein
VENNAQDIRPIEQWGAFYLFRKCLRVRTQSDIWQLEAVQIIGKIILCIMAFVLDLLTGLIYLIFLAFEHSVILVFVVLKSVLNEVLRRLIGVLSFSISLIITIVIVYLLITHWTQFAHFVNHIIAYFNVR